MLSGVEDMLSQGEIVEASVNPSRFDTVYSRNLLLSILGLVVVVAAAVVLRPYIPFNSAYVLLFGILPLAVIVWTELNRNFVMYHFTDRKVVMETGVLNKHFESVMYNDITHTEVQQSLFERIFGVSDIYVNTAGEQDEDIYLNGLKDVQKYRKFIDR